MLRIPSEAVPAAVFPEVVLLAEILPDGRVGRVSVSRSCGSKFLDELARENVSRWLFEPARQPQGGKAVRALTGVRILLARERG